MNKNKLHLFTRIVNGSKVEYLPCRVAKYKVLLNSFKEWLASNPTLNIRTTKNGYQQLDRRSNPELYSWLDTINIWGFFITNEKHNTIALHQLVLFLQTGWKYYVCGFGIEAGKCDTHHLDHNAQNNVATNLCYCSPELNKLCSQAVRYGNYWGKPTEGATETYTEAAELVKLTVERTFDAWGLTAPAIKVVKWLLHLPKYLRSAVTSNWVTLPSVIHATAHISFA